MKLTKATAWLLALVVIISLLSAPSASAEESGNITDTTDTTDTTETSVAPSYDYTATYGFDPLVAPDGAEAQDYVTGPTPPTVYLKAGDYHVVAQNEYKFRDYVFAGWKCGNTLYQPGEIIYNVNSNLEFIAKWKRPESPGISVVGFISYTQNGITTTQSVTVGTTVTLKEGFWQDGHGRIFNGGTSFLMSFGAVDFTQAVSGTETVSVKYDGNGVSTGIQSNFSVLKGGSFIVDGCYARRDGYVFTGWSDGNGRVYTAGDTCIATKDTVLSAIWRESAKPAPDYCTVTVSVGKGGTALPAGKSTIEKGQSFTFSVTADEDYKLTSVTCNGAELGTIGEYTLVVKENLSISVGFEEIPKPPVVSQPPEDNSVEESKPVADSDTETSTEESQSADTDKQGSDDDNKKLLVIVFAMVVCVGGIAAAVWFASKSNTKKRKPKK